MTKQITPAALDVLKEALACIYWYKRDLERFIRYSVSDAGVLARLDFGGFKRAVASDLVDALASDQLRHQGDLLELMGNVVAFDDFTHLERLEDGEEKAARARAAVAAVKRYYDRHADIRAEREAADERRAQAQRAMQQNQAVQNRLSELRQLFLQMMSLPHQERGYQLESLLTGLFELFDLDPKASFKVVGEQIDGAFTFDGTDYLLEARWRQDPSSADALDHFSKKVERKLENTLGLFIAFNGFQPTAVDLYSQKRSPIVLMDGGDLFAVVEGRITLPDTLLRKRRHAAQTGNVYLPISRLLS